MNRGTDINTNIKKHIFGQQQVTIYIYAAFNKNYDQY